MKEENSPSKEVLFGLSLPAIMVVIVMAVLLTKVTK